MTWRTINGGLFWASVVSVGYTYAGYPIALELLRRGRGTRPAATPARTELPAVTVLIAAYNEAASIRSKLENTLALDYPKDLLQILVAADGSDDATPHIVAEYENRGVELSFSQERRGKMAAITRAMAAVRGDIVVMSDANNSYAPEAVTHLVAPFADPTVAVTTGAKTIEKGDGALGDSEGLYWRYESWIKRNETALGCCTGVAGEIIAMRRSLFTPPPEGIINDDFFLAMQAIKRGYRVVYVPQARSSERVSLSAEDEVARRARIVAGRFQAIAMSGRLLPFDRPTVVWQVVSHKFLRPLVPLAMVAAALSNTLALLPFASDGRPSRARLLALGRPYAAIAFAAQAAFYCAALAGSRLGDGALAKVAYVPRFLVDSNWAALVGLIRFLTRRQSALWQRASRRDEMV